MWLCTRIAEMISKGFITRSIQKLFRNTWFQRRRIKSDRIKLGVTIAENISDEICGFRVITINNLYDEPFDNSDKADEGSYQVVIKYPNKGNGYFEGYCQGIQSKCPSLLQDSR
jgi:hypothetical protein